jgi:hypothetical protein
VKMFYTLLRSAHAGAAARLAAWVAALALTIVSLVPGAFRPQLGLPGPLEHAIAYALTGIAFATAYPGIRERWMAFLGLSAASGLFELLQNVIPGRSPALLDVAASSSGAATGLIIGSLVASAASLFLRPSVAEQPRKPTARRDAS